MSGFDIIKKIMYDKPMKGTSIMSCYPVEILGEQFVRLEDGEIIRQFIYNIIWYTPENGKPFITRDCNIILDKED